MADGQSAPAETDIVGRISAILAAENAPPEQQPVAEAPPEEQAANTEIPQTPAAEETPPEQNTAVEGEEAPDDRVTEIPLDQLEAIALEVTVKGDDGRDIVEKPTIKELRDGYMRQKDYSRKTAEVARQRDEVGEKVRQAIESERSAYQQTLKQLQEIVTESVAPELKNVDWNALSTNDPFEYVRLRNRAEQITNTLNAIKTKNDELTTKQKAEQSQTLQKVAREARQTLESDIPGFSDTLYQTLMQSGQKYGYKVEEVATWVDPRAIKVLHDAYQYQQLKAEKPPAKNRVVVAPKVVKPGATTQQPKTVVEHQKAMERLQKTGSIQDVAAVIRARMG